MAAEISGDNLNDINLDGDMLVGVGTKSKGTGFLKGGGAGGRSVFMGVGYVDGVVEESSSSSRRQMRR